MKQKSRIRSIFCEQRMLPVFGGLLGVLVFLLTYGVRVLDPTCVDWLLTGGDLSQHYLGWELFRQSPWEGMPGMGSHMAYPYRVSVIFTDSIPLFSILFKLLWKNIPGRMQFFGYWGLMCFFLQGFLGTKILQSYQSRKDLLRNLQILAGTLLLILCPYMMRRMYWHSSLAAHFLILAGLYLFLTGEKMSRERAVFSWLLLGVLCSLIHLYFLAMLGAVLLAFVLRRLLGKNREGLFLIPMGYCTGALGALILLGAFSSGMGSGAPGIGYYSFNLNGLFHPEEGWSALLPELSWYADGQYEGFSYVGAGALLLMVCGLVSFFRKGRVREILSGLFLILALVIASASNEVSFGKYLLLKYPVPDLIMKVWSPFRSSGRLIWPAAYLLTIWGIRGCMGLKLPGSVKLVDITQNGKGFAVRTAGVFSAVLLLAGAVLQVVDLAPKLSSVHRSMGEEKQYENPVPEDIFRAVDADGSLQISHLVFLDKDDLSQETLYGLTNRAIDRGWSVNDFYFARYFMMPAVSVARDFAGHTEKDCLYVLRQDKALQTFDLPLTWYAKDGLLYGTATPISGLTPVRRETLSVENIFAREDMVDGSCSSEDRMVLFGGDAVAECSAGLLPAGAFEVRVLGENLDGAEFEAYDGDGDAVHLTMTSHESLLTTFSFVLKNPAADVRIRVRAGNGQKQIGLRQVQIERISF